MVNPGPSKRRQLYGPETWAEIAGAEWSDLDGPRRSLTERLSLYRAFHTAGLEFADAADDSYGTIGRART